MKIFVFDTETTGFINKLEKDLEKQPRIIQFAWILCELLPNGESTILEEVNIMIHPWIPIPFESSQVHHIYDIDVIWKPKIDEVLDTIIKYINEPDLLVWHNIEFDEEMVKLELKRLSREYDYKPKKTLCTMRNTVDICKIEVVPWRYKFPKLGELHKHLFGEYFIGAHDALVDVKATLRCFEKLHKDKLINIWPMNTQEVLTLF